MIKIDRILVPTDFRECAEKALEYAAELATRFDSELHLLHVAVLPTAPYAHGFALPEEAMHPEIPAAKALNALDVPRSEDVAGVERAVRSGTPFVEIVRQAKEYDVDLIVIGTHGSTGLTHMLLGSVAEKVVRKAPCPVLSVRPDGHQFVMP